MPTQRFKLFETPEKTLRQWMRLLNYMMEHLDDENVTLTIGAISGITAASSEINILDGAVVTTAELNKLSGLTAATSELNLVNASTPSGLNQITTPITLHKHNLAYGAQDVTATVTEVNKLSGAGATLASGTEQAKINDPSGGTTIDAEARTAINLVIDALEVFGITST